MALRRTRPLRKIACIGEVMIELVTHQNSADLNVAGDTYNTAVYLSRLLAHAERQVSYITALGTDSFSDRILNQIKHYGIGTDHIERRQDKTSGLYAILTDDSGERSFTYWRSDSAARTLFSSPATIGLDVLENYDLIFLSGITLAILPDAIRQALMAALDRFRANGGTVAYDSNHRPRLWEGEETARQINGQMWQRADIALPSVDDEMQIFGEDFEGQVLTRLRNAGATYGALKRGSRGPVSLSATENAITFPSVSKVIDSTAAGDSFNAGFLAQLVQGNSIDDAMRAGHDLASKVIQHRGAIISI
ncbi:MAG: sugar kinase [Pikeienuella sp.]